jgi:probable FeS assembly SUF system protein SufT
MNDSYRLNRDCPATLIPAGNAVVLPAGSEVFVTQTLGGNVTVRTDNGLFRIAAADAGALEGYVPAAATAAAAVGAAPEGAAGDFSEGDVWEALKTCFDPEIPVNIVDLGLVYDLAVEATPTGRHKVDVKMTLTAQGCGMGPIIAEDARQKIAGLPTVEAAKVHIVWDPIWTPQMISPAGRKVLGLE